MGLVVREEELEFKILRNINRGIKVSSAQSSLRLTWKEIINSRSIRDQQVLHTGKQGLMRHIQLYDFISTACRSIDGEKMHTIKLRLERILF